MISITAIINNRQHALFRAFFWYLLALLSSRSAPRVSFLVLSTFTLIRSSWSPCSCTICATSLKSSFNSPTDCSIFRISDSRSMISDSWKSTSSWLASRSCSCSCSCACCCEGSPDGDMASSRATRALEAEDRCFSMARRCTVWNSSREALNSRASFCWVYFWAGCALH